MLTKIFGECSQVKLIDFLVAHPWSEFSKTELAEGAQITRPTVYKLLDKLLGENIIIKTKKVGNIQLYQTNRNSPVIKHISSLQELLANMEIENQTKSFKEEPVELSEKKLDEMLGLDHQKESLNNDPREVELHGQKVKQ
nr:winged helix-turn-helix domain-containing protein [uncultured Methanobacterium sp.]